MNIHNRQSNTQVFFSLKFVNILLQMEAKAVKKMRLHFFNSAVIANSKMDYFTGCRLIRRTLKPLFPTLEKREGSWGRNMSPAIVSGIVT